MSNFQKDNNDEKSPERVLTRERESDLCLSREQGKYRKEIYVILCLSLYYAGKCMQKKKRDVNE